MRSIGLYFGSFNPIHQAHVELGKIFLKISGVDEVLFVVSPHNPFKAAKDLAPQQDRLAMVSLALAGEVSLSPSAIEFELPSPSYTIQTLEYLWKAYPGAKLSILMGEDNLNSLHLWKSFDRIIESCPIYWYPRSGSFSVNEALSGKAVLHKIDAPQIDVSSTEIRHELTNGNRAPKHVDPSVLEYILKNHLYV
jgi:nicotinate-nucleotide adenylyltransferase